MHFRNSTGVPWTLAYKLSWDRIGCSWNIKVKGCRTVFLQLGPCLGGHLSVQTASWLGLKETQESTVRVDVGIGHCRTYKPKSNIWGVKKSDMEWPKNNWKSVKGSQSHHNQSKMWSETGIRQEWVVLTLRAISGWGVRAPRSTVVLSPCPPCLPGCCHHALGWLWTLSNTSASCPAQLHLQILKHFLLGNASARKRVTLRSLSFHCRPCSLACQGYYH